MGDNEPGTKQYLNPGELLDALYFRTIEKRKASQQNALQPVLQSNGRLRKWVRTNTKADFIIIEEPKAPRATDSMILSTNCFHMVARLVDAIIPNMNFSYYVGQDRLVEEICQAFGEVGQLPPTVEQVMARSASRDKPKYIVLGAWCPLSDHPLWRGCLLELIFSQLVQKMRCCKMRQPRPSGTSILKYFEELLQQLPSDVYVFIIVYGVGDHKFLDEVQTLVNFLWGLRGRLLALKEDEDKAWPHLRVLFAGPGANELVTKKIPEADRDGVVIPAADLGKAHPAE